METSAFEILCQYKIDHNVKLLRDLKLFDNE